MNKKSLGRFKDIPEVVLIGLGFGFFYWLIDATFSVLVFRDESFFESLFSPNSEQIWMRFFIIFLLIVFSMVVQAIVNKRRRTEENLLESEGRYRRLAEASIEGIVIHDGQYIIDVSPVAADILGYQVNELIGKSPLEYISPDFKETVAGNIRSGYSLPYDAAVKRKDGTITPIEASARPTVIDDREVRVVAIRDITERKRVENDLRTREKRYRLLFNSGNDPLLVIGLKDDGTAGNLIEVNETACRMFGYDREEFLELKPADLLVPQERDNLVQIMQNLRDFRNTIFETEITDKKEMTRPVEFSCHLFTIDRDTMVIITIRDTSERKKAEISLKASEKRFRKLYDDGPLMYQALDAGGKILETNDRWAAFIGIHPEEIINHNIGDYLTEESAARFREEYATILSSGVPDRLEMQVRRGDQAIADVIMDIWYETDEKDRLRLAHCVINDISELKQDKSAEPNDDPSYRYLFEYTEEIVISATATGEISSPNPAFEAITGWSGDKLTGQKIGHFIHPDDRGFVEQALKKAAEGECLPPAELRLRYKSGDFHPLHFRLIPVTAGQKVAHVQVIARPIRAEKSTEPDMAGLDLEAIVNSVDEPAFITAADMTIAAANDEMVEWCRGRELAPELGGSAVNESLAVLGSGFADDLEKMLHTGRAINVATCLGENEPACHLIIRNISLVDAGEAVYILSLLSDVSVTESDEPAPAVSPDGFLSMMPQAVMIFDTDETITAINPLAAEAIGQSAGEIIGKNLGDLAWQIKTIGRDENDPAPHPVTQVRESGRASDRNFIGLHDDRDDSYRWFLAGAFPEYRRDSEETARIILVMSDITDWYHIYRLAHAQRNLGLALNRASSLDDTLRVCLEAALEISGMDSGMIYLRNNRTGDIDGAYHSGLSEAFAQAVTHYDGDHGNVELLTRGEPIYTTVDQVVIEPKKLVHREGLRGLAILPIKNGGEVVGSLNVSSHTMTEIQADSREALEVITAQIADAIGRARTATALAESERRFRQMAETINEVFWMSSIDNSRQIYISPAFEAIWGFPCDRLYENSTAWLDAVHPDDRERVEKARSRQLSGDYDIEYRIVRPDDSVRWIRDRGYPVYNDFGEICNLVGIATDITDVKEAELALRKEKEMADNIINSAQNIIMVLDNQGCIVSINPYLEQLCDYRLEDIRGSECIKLFADEGSRDQIKELFQKTLENEATQGMQFDLMANDGRRLTIEWYCHVLRESGGETIGILATGVDITERLRADEALYSSEKFNRAIIENSPLGLAVCDSNGRLLSYNDAWQEIWQLTDNEIRGMMGTECDGGLDFNRQREYLGDNISKVEEIYRRGGQLHLPEIRVDKHASGETRWITQHYYAVKNEAAETERVIVITEDITERKQAEEALRESEQRYRVLFDSAPLAFGISDRDGRIVAGNEALWQLHGISNDDRENFKISETHVDTGDHQRLMEMLTVDHTVNDFETRFYRGDGTIFHASMTVTRIVLDGRDAYLAMIKDVTESLKAAEALRQNEERLRLAIQNLPVMIDAFDEDENIIVWNRECERVTGYTAGEIIGNPEAMKLLYPDDEYRDKMLARMRNINNKCTNWEWVLTRKDGSKKIISWTNVTREHAVPGWHSWAVGVDITERQKAEEKLLESEERYRSIVSNSVDGIWVLNGEGTCLEWNEGLEKITGIPRDEAIGQPIWDLEYRLAKEEKKTPEFLDYLKTQRMQFFTDGESPCLDRFHELEVIRPDGEFRIIQMLSFPIKTRQGLFLGSFARDITEQKLHEAEQTKAEKLESVGVLAGGIAHDFNNILTAILGNISLARLDARNNEELSTRLGEAEKASLRAQELTHQLLTFSKGGSPIKKAASIGEIIRESCSFSLRGSNVRCDCTIADDLATAEVDEGQISQVLNNLIINADHAMADGGQLRVGADNVELDDTDNLPLKPGRYLKITISDTGTGIPEEHLSRIFDPYFTTKQKGSGLGLATTYSIIKNHDGHIDVESRLGTGTTFTIFIPASEHGPQVPAGKERQSARGKGRILVMDDEEAIQRVTGITLTRLGYEVDFAENGEKAIEKYQRAMDEGKRYDAVIIDLTIPGGMGGKEAIGHLKKIDPEVKAIVSSGYSNDPILADYTRYGFSGMIIKPYKATTIGNVVQQVLSGGKIPTP